MPGFCEGPGWNDAERTRHARGAGAFSVNMPELAAWEGGAVRFEPKGAGCALRPDTRGPGTPTTLQESVIAALRARRSRLGYPAG